MFVVDLTKLGALSWLAKTVVGLILKVMIPWTWRKCIEVLAKMQSPEGSELSERLHADPNGLYRLLDDASGQGKGSQGKTPNELAEGVWESHV